MAEFEFRTLVFSTLKVCESSTLKKCVFNSKLLYQKKSKKTKKYIKFITYIFYLRFECDRF